MDESTGPRAFGQRGIAAMATSAVILAAVLAFAALRRPEGVPATAARAVRKDLVVPILSDGTLEPPAGGELRAADRARVAAIHVREGERVQKGATLLELDEPALSTQARDARSAAQELGVQRARAAAELDSEKGEASRLTTVVEADVRLLAEGAIPRATAEADDLALRRATERVRAAQAQADSLGGGAGPSRVELARTSAQELERRVSLLVIRAPTDGVVYGLPRRAGEAVEAGQILASVADPDHLRVRVRVDQPDLPRVAAGQRLVVTFDGLPDRKWEGRVTVVSPGLRDVAGRQVGEIQGEIADPTSALPPNASVNVTIVVAEKKAALLIPRGAIHRDGERRFVWVEKGGRAHRADVGLGVLGPNEAEVVNGLAEGDRVLLPGAAPLSEGVRVALRDS
ncbi:MAG: efflux RND transporter periplasmic adaptor subunit [Thermoanaerobaculia bacterium]